MTNVPLFNAAESHNHRLMYPVRRMKLRKITEVFPNKKVT